MGFILMYDVTNEESFNAVQDWYIYYVITIPILTQAIVVI